MINLFLSLIFLIVSPFLMHYSLSQKTQEKRISDINVLLPVCEKADCNRVSYSVHAHGGCFEWTVDKPGFIEMTPSQGKEDGEGCYHKVKIAPQNNKMLNEIVWLVAKDKKSNEQFRCKVGFGKVHKLQIAKRFEKMNVEDITGINVNAFDENGNIFSSLKGFRFKWKISDGNIVQLLKLSSEKISAGKKRLEVEKKHHSDMILLKGINTGKVLLSAELLEEDYSGLKSDDRKLYVVEPFQIYPSEPLYILPDNSFNFDLEILTNYPQNEPKFVISYNRKFYKWTSENLQCGQVKNFGDFLSSSKTCKCKIFAEDTRIDNFNKANTQVNVVHPTSLEIALLEISEEEAKNLKAQTWEDSFMKLVKKIEYTRKNEYIYSNTWKLVSGRKYLVKNILMHETHPVHYSLNSIKFDNNFESMKNYTESLNCFHGGEVCLLTTKSTSSDYVQIESKINPGFGVDKLYNIKKNVKIFSQLQIEKFGRSQFTLPYLGYLDNSDEENSNGLRSQELRLIVKGGTGTYLFSSFNSEVAQIKNQIIYGKYQGKTTIKVTDSEIPTNFDSIELEVLDAKDFTYFEERQEIEIGNDFYVNPMALKGNIIQDYNLNSYLSSIFTNCTNLRMNTSISLKDENLKSLEEDNNIKDYHPNFHKVRNFLESNPELIKTKLSYLDLKVDETNDYMYLNWANFGICDTRGFKTNTEGLIRLPFHATLNLKKTGHFHKILSTSPARIYIYSSLSLFAPNFEDSFTRQLLGKGSLAESHKYRNYILAPGSSVTLRFSGGVIPWSESQKAYGEDIILIESSKNRTLSPENVKNEVKFVQDTPKEIYILCIKESEEREIKVTVKNNRDRTLLRPGQSSVSLIFGCSFPKFLSIFFLGNKANSLSQNTMIKNEELSEVFSIPQKPGIEYFEKKSSIEQARVYAFDVYKRMLYNISSIQGPWTYANTVEKTLFKILNEKDILAASSRNSTTESTEINKASPEYIQNYIQFENIVSKFDLVYTTKSALSHYATINLIDFPSLNPNNITAYLSKNNIIEIEIHNGSGDFEVSLSDEYLASFEYYNRKILISPLKEGLLYVYVKDNKINNSFRAISSVYISKIKKISLIGGGLLMVNNTMDIGIKVYDNFNGVFPSSQVQKMNLQIADLETLTKGLAITADKVLVDKFVIKGLLSDVYSIYIKEYENRLTSNNLRVEVFDQFRVFPESLLMVPGSSFTLKILGGPVHEQHVLKKFEMVNSNIATVEIQEPEVKALTLGKTVLRIVLSLNPDYVKFYSLEDEHKDQFNKNIILAVKEVSVRVDFPDRVAIRGAVNRKLYTKSTVRLFAALKLGEDFFTYAVGPFNFDWSLDNTLIAKFRFYKSPRDCRSHQNSLNDECHEDKADKNPVMTNKNLNPFNSLGIFLTTYGQGSIDIKLTVTITYPKPYEWRKPNIFTKNEKILIQDEIYVDIPEFYEYIPNKSSMYLVPLNIDHELHTNKNNYNSKYSIISQHGTEANIKDNLISLTPSGRMTTFFQTGMAHVLINQREKENPAFIPVVLPVFVTEYYSLFTEKSYHLIDMEIGEEVIFKIILQHEYGILFADGKFERFSLKSHESHPRVARVELLEHNSKIKIKAYSKGDTNIILYEPSTGNIHDVFQISVFTTLLIPQTINLNVGGKINFLQQDEKRKLYLSQDSMWTSDDESVFRVDPVEGFGYGLKEGSALIQLISKDMKKTKLSTRVNVVRVNSITMNQRLIPSFLTDIKTNSNYQSEYQIPVNFFIDREAVEELKFKDEINEINHNLMFKCISNNPEIYTTETFEIGDYKGCLIKIRERKYTSNVVPPREIEFVVSADSKGEKPNDFYSYQTTFKLPFISSFKIKNDIKSLNFSRNNRTHILRIDNLNDVEVEVEDSNLVKVEVNTEEEENYIKLYIPSDAIYFSDLKLSLKNKNTNQKEEILINYSEEVKENQTEYIFWIFRRDLVIDILTTIVFIVIIYILYSQTNKSDEVAPAGGEFMRQGPNVSASRAPQGRNIGGISSTYNMNK